MAACKVLSRFVAVLLIVALGMSGSAQETPALSKKALAIKHTADSLTPHSRMSVIPTQGDEEFGEFLSNNQEGLTFLDVDRKIEVTLRYADIRKIKKGYGGYNNATGTHIDRTKSLVVVALVVGAIGALLAAVATAKN